MLCSVIGGDWGRGLVVCAKLLHDATSYFAHLHIGSSEMLKRQSASGSADSNHKCFN